MVAQAAIIVAVAIPFGFELHLAGAVIGLLILAVFCVGLGALSYTLALASKNQDWMFWTVQQTLLFPLLLLAGMLLPLDAARAGCRRWPGPTRCSYVVDAERAPVQRRDRLGTVLSGAIAAAVVAVLGLLVGTRAMKRSPDLRLAFMQAHKRLAYCRGPLHVRCGRGIPVAAMGRRPVRCGSGGAVAQGSSHRAWNPRRTSVRIGSRRRPGAARRHARYAAARVGS